MAKYQIFAHLPCIYIFSLFYPLKFSLASPFAPKNVDAGATTGDILVYNNETLWSWIDAYSI